MTHRNLSARKLSALLAALVAACFAYAGGWMHGRYVMRAINETLRNQEVYGQAAGEQVHDLVHDHSGSQSLELTLSARKNLGLTDEYLRPLELKSYQKSIAVPAIVVDRPGRTRLPISAGMTGIITHVHAVEGEAVEPGDLILEMRLTHEDLVTAQKDFLQSLGDRDIEKRELVRLEKVANSGAVASKTFLERQYNADKLDSLIASQREGLRLHGLSTAQIAKIESDRRLLTEISVFAPKPDEHGEEEIHLSRPTQLQPHDMTGTFRVASTHESLNGKTKSSQPPAHVLVIQNLRVQKGQVVNAGELLCTLADFDQLLIEGQAFESEIAHIANAKKSGWEIEAALESGGESQRIKGLSLQWLNNEMDPDTRTLRFYVGLQNRLETDERALTGQRHVGWKYRIGQRMRLLVPVEKWADQFILPVEAVVREGIDSYVFQENGDHFDRVSIHEKHRDQTHVVVENDGALFPGDVVALRGAHQMQMALKSKSGGAVDPHAGHNH